VDGYTVEEAASVLGVPRERVWELLARGVIAGSTDLGGAMRVRLKAEPPPESIAAPLERPADAGSGASAELTPFRELLTEFRSLTERYGQALLALGEARGEVAGLRSRVDMLEARVDLRLPSSAPPISSSWSSTPWPTPTERVVQPPSPRTAAAAIPAEEGATTAEHEEVDAPPAHEDESTPHRRRGRAGRRATERFADALARAEDPSLAELPGAAETAAALAAMRQDHPPEAARFPESDGSDRDAEASFPRELPSADHVPVADEAEPRLDTDAAPTIAVATTVDAEGAGPPDVAPDADVEPVTAGQPLPDGEPARSAAGGGEPTVHPAPVARAEAEAEPEIAPEPEPQTQAEAEPAPVAASAEESGGTEGDSESDLAWDPERYSAAIEEPGWISADEVPAPTPWIPPREVEAEAEAEPPAAWIPPREAEAAPDAAPRDSGEGAADDSPTDAPTDAPALMPSPTMPMSAASTAIPIESSGSRELDEGLAALDALANPQPPVTDAAEHGEQAEGGSAWATGMEREAQAVGAPRPQTWVRPSPPPPLTTRSSASRAYRRLRRIFPT